MEFRRSKFSRRIRKKKRLGEFRRFGFPDRYYCSVVDDFRDSIAAYEEKLYELEIPKETSRELENLRNPFQISKKWVHFLESVVLKMDN